MKLWRVDAASEQRQRRETVETRRKSCDAGVESRVCAWLLVRFKVDDVHPDAGKSVGRARPAAARALTQAFVASPDGSGVMLVRY